MSKVRIGVKRLVPEAALPYRAHPADAGADVRAVRAEFHPNKVYIDSKGKVTAKSSDGVQEYGIGLAFDIPEGYWIDFRSRSSIWRTRTILSNSVGTIDSGYTGEVKAFFYVSEDSTPYTVGDRIGQLVVMPNVSPLDVEFYEVEELPETDRGSGGFGSTGK